MKIEFRYAKDDSSAESNLSMLVQSAAVIFPDAEVVPIPSADGAVGADSISLDGRLIALHPEPVGGELPRWRFDAALLQAKQPQGLLFLCVANSARSQLGEGVARQLAPKGVCVQSAGSHPSRVRPEAASVLAEIGVDTSAHFSKNVTDIDPATVDTVVTLCAEEECPVFLGKATRLHWGLPDPAAVQGDETARLNAFRAARDELINRLSMIWPNPDKN